MNEHGVLIADSGSTKTNWCLITEDQDPKHFNTEGYNPFFVDAVYIADSLKSSFPDEFAYPSIKEVHFYGAGCQDSKIARSEEHTSELQSRENLVCRLLL